MVHRRIHRLNLLRSHSLKFINAFTSQSALLLRFTAGIYLHPSRLPHPDERRCIPALRFQSHQEAGLTLRVDARRWAAAGHMADSAGGVSFASRAALWTARLHWSCHKPLNAASHLESVKVSNLLLRFDVRLLDL